ncbi:MAG: radical SAM protein [Anaerolineaceae bacterium]|nr:radical SAM protein [Anaerolineaceae bacterium]
MPTETSIRLHRFEPSSRVNGPGLRAVIWVQGCALGCPGCFNPETHDFQGGEIWTVEQLAQRLLDLQNGLEGLTISGGEPAHQHRALTLLLKKVREQSSLSVVVFSGYEMAELQRIPRIEAFLSTIDVLIAGRYDASQRVARGLVGSANKTAHFLTGRYSAKDLEDVPQAEILLSPDGEIILSGIDPLRWIEPGEKD